jgi:hypothetical protein
MRCAVLDVYEIKDETSLKNVIPLLGDDSEEVAGIAREKIRNAGYQNSLRLVKSLSLPQKKVREALFNLLDDMAIKDLDVFRFIQTQARLCYQLIIQAQGVRQLPDRALQQLLAVHLDERAWFTLQTALRVLAAQDRSGRMHLIVRSLFSSDMRQQANSLEAMDDIMDKSLIRMLMPLLEEMDVPDRIAAGKRLFPAEVKDLSTSGLFEDLMESRNWVTLTLGLILMRQLSVEPKSMVRITSLTRHTNPHVAMAAGQIAQEKPGRQPVQETAMETMTATPLTDKILALRSIEIFADLSINELAAVASVTEEADFNDGEHVFREGERGDTLFLVLDGDVAVIKNCDEENEIELDSIGAA